ncbi:hypothetical protein P872_20250 [Rhodonellum psychrophilum GCM71 = DSM 17998]|uniref:AAA+ ATPase domain-containing protein n=2 Tax=Rhodonellum TaxID=336827 RepID=U5BL57_9BACT|nr:MULTISPECIES: ATP-binding protein [Rhodonellum]ERM81220.1 hypothetical protein P872_20250 [Rhodonellum psychrophilum GCM71 = DSM 17998]MDO9554666.1 ATP-binding protein [Rhodonellum sp.]SDZ52287.1 ATPase family associated with various cellular activities (AAA) [Rhodonellum ikkaensis]
MKEETKKELTSNAACLEMELQWFQSIMVLRGKITFEESVPESEMGRTALPDFSGQESNYAKLVQKHNMGLEERLVLILSLIPDIRPSLLDLLHVKNQNFDTPFAEFGGLKAEKHKGFLPTGETAIFLLAGSNIKRRFELMALFSQNHFFAKEKIIFLDKSLPGEPLLSGQLRISKEYLLYLTTGEPYKPDADIDFPAQRIITEQKWEDLILSDPILDGISEIKNWLKHGKELKEQFDFGRRIKKGFKVLFTGPPGTGKTFTASVLGQSCNMDVYRIDLSMVVSKYIGETEKNLSKIFDLGENKGWILFFDEADALFGKRSQTSDSHDRYANQEVSYLLQRIEDFDGLVILSSNFKNNIDEAFFRRFQLVLDFELPDFSQRMQFWENSVSDQFHYHPEVSVEKLAERHELSGSSIINVLHFCLLKCLERGDREIINVDILSGIRIEKIKQGKSILH